MKITPTAKNGIQSAIYSVDWETDNVQPAELDAIIDLLSRLDGFYMDLVGPCLWVSGATRACDSWSMELKEAGFRLGSRCYGEKLLYWFPGISDAD